MLSALSFWRVTLGKLAVIQWRRQPEQGAVQVLVGARPASKARQASQQAREASHANHQARAARPAQNEEAGAEAGYHDEIQAAHDNE